ncbi:MAG: peptide deformylase [Aquificae bacterium]|nr:peptide deformylase [Aquificota bacterium]
MSRIRVFPDPVLTTPTEKVTAVDGEVKKLIKEMFRVMYEAEGVGLAANQIGEPVRLLVVDTSLKEGVEPVKLVLINPEITHREGSVKSKEGCLSFPGLTVELKRARKVTVKGLNEEGEEVELTLEGFPAVVLQHELDHLMGRTFLDHLPAWRRRLALERYRKLLKEQSP